MWGIFVCIFNLVYIKFGWMDSAGDNPDSNMYKTSPVSSRDTAMGS